MQKKRLYTQDLIDFTHYGCENIYIAIASPMQCVCVCVGQLDDVNLSFRLPIVQM